MAAKKKKPTETYETLSIKVTGFESRIAAGINYEIKNKHRQQSETRIYRYDSTLEISGVCTYPEDRANHEFQFSIMGEDHGFQNHALTLKQCHALGKDGDWLYKKVRGCEEPVYDLPHGMGTVEKVRGEPVWRSYLWIPLDITGQMLMSLNSDRNLYIEIHEKRVDRRRWVVSLSLQTENPLD